MIKTLEQNVDTCSDQAILVIRDLDIFQLERILDSNDQTGYIFYFTGPGLKSIQTYISKNPKSTRNFFIMAPNQEPNRIYKNQITNDG